MERTVSIEEDRASRDSGLAENKVAFLFIPVLIRTKQLLSCHKTVETDVPSLKMSAFPVFGLNRMVA